MLPEGMKTIKGFEGIEPIAITNGYTMVPIVPREGEVNVLLVATFSTLLLDKVVDLPSLLKQVDADKKSEVSLIVLSKRKNEGLFEIGDLIRINKEHLLDANNKESTVMLNKLSTLYRDTCSDLRRTTSENINTHFNPTVTIRVVIQIPMYDIINVELDKAVYGGIEDIYDKLGALSFNEIIAPKVATL